MTREELEKENAELRAIAENQQSSNMSRYFENKKLKEGLAVGSTFNKALNSMNKNLEAQIEKMKSDVISERDEALRVEDIITYTVLNGIIDKWEIKENE